MHSERIIQLLAKRMGKAATEAELNELQELLKQHPEHHYFIELLQSIEGEKIHQGPALSEKMLVDESWNKLQLEMNGTVPVTTTNTAFEAPSVVSNGASRMEIRPTPVSSLKMRHFLRYAAIWGGVILVAGSVFLLWKQSGRQQSPRELAQRINQVAVPYGMPEKRMLPDSTIVWLNAGSRIRYAEDFIQEKREVYLEGEGFFDVKHDPEHPFIVHAGNIAVRALGTQFNVHAYLDDNTIEATLISGKVQITMSDKPDQRIILDPNEKLTVTKAMVPLPGKRGQLKQEVSYQVQSIAPQPVVSAIPEVAWMQDKLAFQHEPFRELSKKMERRYNKQIHFVDSTLGNERLTGVFENETIRKALGLLQMTTPFRYRFQGDTVYLSRN